MLSSRLLPLRERREDLGLLIAALLQRHRPRDAASVSFTPEAARALALYSWPLNIRELEQCLRFAVPLARGGSIDVCHLPAALRTALGVHSAPQATNAAPAPAVEERLRAQLLSLLAEHAGNIAAVAREIGCSRARVYRWLDDFGINRGRDRE